ncbi:MAG: hypothetical protein ACRDYB_12300 [Acidimicrobiales bacterium]
MAEGTGPADPGFSDEELTELALGAEPGTPLAEGAVPLAVYLGQEPGPLPEWYMPPPMARGHPAWRLPVVMAIVGAFLVIEALGLCSTYGALGLG